MNDIWFEPHITQDDLLAFARALSLEGKAATPFLAIASGDDGIARLVSASESLFGLFDSPTAEALSTRLLQGSDPGARRLSILARTMPSDGAPRLERLRFFLGPGSEIITFLCRRVTVRGRPVFLAAALGIRADLVGSASLRAKQSAPDISGAGEEASAHSARPTSDVSSRGEELRAPLEPSPLPPAMIVASDVIPDATHPEPEAVVVSSPPAVAPRIVAPRTVAPRTVAALQADLRARWPIARKLRFLWHTDADAICTSITPPLAEVVGHGTADLVGRNLLALAPQLDPTGRLAGRLGARETWSGLDLNWPMADEAATIAVTAGAIPAFDPDKAFAGFRGFGVIHLDRVSEGHPTTFARAPTLAPATLVQFPAGSPLTADEEHAFQKIGATLRDDAPSAPDHPPRRDSATEVVEIEPFAQQMALSHIGVSGAENDAGLDATPEHVALETTSIDHRLDPPLVPASPSHQSIERIALPGSNDIATSPARALIAPSTSRGEEIGRNGLTVLDKLGVGVLVSRDNIPIFANRHLLDTLGFADEDALHAAGGMTHLFGGLPGNVTGSEAVGVRGRDGAIIPANARMQAIDWDGLPATLLTLRPTSETGKVGSMPRSAQVSARDLTPEARQTEPASPSRVVADDAIKADVGHDLKRQQDEKRLRDDEVRELRAILETATDGVAVLDGAFTVVSLNRSGEALFGCDRSEVVGKPFLTLFAPHNQSLASDYCQGLKSNATKSLLNDGREILVRAHQGGTIPVFMTLGRLGPSGLATAGETHADARYCALFRDLTHWKKVEQELEHARRDAEHASALKSDFLAKVSHEIRTPLNAIIGFAEVIMDERFGPVGNARYKDYLKDIHYSGTHVMSLVNDLLDLSKIEAGKMELNAVAIDANKIVTECVGIMQPQASQERVIMRLSLAATLPLIKADERSLRQIVLNLLSNAVKFNEPGGQVIVATALTDGGQVVIRIRDTGPGMSDKDIETALEPFRQLSTSRPMTTGTGLGLPLTKALVEANHASFTIRSKIDQGTLVEVAFPTAPVHAS